MYLIQGPRCGDSAFPCVLCAGPWSFLLLMPPPAAIGLDITWLFAKLSSARLHLTAMFGLIMARGRCWK